jgi:putative addiction module component (TIGR02574 family)
MPKLIEEIMAQTNINDQTLVEQIKKLSIPERILIVEDIWDSIAVSNEELSIKKEQKAELNRRLNDYNNNKLKSSNWKTVKRRIESKI